jgi:hypothetical protein
MSHSAGMAWKDVALRLLAACGAPLPQETVRQWAEHEAEILTRACRAKIDGLYHLSCGTNSPAQELNDAVWSMQRRELMSFVKQLDDQHVPTLVFKGAEFRDMLFASRSISFMKDCDVLVPRSEIGRAKQAAYLTGFRQASFDPAAGQLVDDDLTDVASIEIMHYFISAFRKLVPLELSQRLLDTAVNDLREPLCLVDGQCFVVVTLDIHHNVATDVSPDPFFKRAVPSALGVGQTFSAADHLWFTASRYYNEVAVHGKRTLRELAFLVALLKDTEIGPPLSKSSTHTIWDHRSTTS